MMKIKNIIYVLITVLTLSVFSCKTSDPIGFDNYGAGQMYNTFERKFTVVQFDSICTADRISNNLDKWHKLYGKDGETNKPYIIYMYIKSLGNSECIYRLIRIDEKSYKITKRVEYIN